MRSLWCLEKNNATTYFNMVHWLVIPRPHVANCTSTCANQKFGSVMAEMVKDLATTAATCVWCSLSPNILHSRLILRGKNFEVFMNLRYPWNFNHQTFYWRNYNGIYLVKWCFQGLFSYNLQKYIPKKFLLSNPQKLPPLKSICYMVTAGQQNVQLTYQVANCKVIKLTVSTLDKSHHTFVTTSCITWLSNYLIITYLIIFLNVPWMLAATLFVYNPNQLSFEHLILFCHTHLYYWSVLSCYLLMYIQQF